MLSGALGASVETAAKAGAADRELKSLKKACDGMESGFLKQMLAAMHRTVAEAKPLGDDTGADTYKDMMDGAVADRLAERGALGISKMTFHATAGRVLNDALKEKR